MQSLRTSRTASASTAGLLAVALLLALAGPALAAPADAPNTDGKAAGSPTLWNVYTHEVAEPILGAVGGLREHQAHFFIAFDCSTSFAIDYREELHEFVRAMSAWMVAPAQVAGQAPRSPFFAEGDRLTAAIMGASKRELTGANSAESPFSLDPEVRSSWLAVLNRRPTDPSGKLAPLPRTWLTGTQMGLLRMAKRAADQGEFAVAIIFTDLTEDDPRVPVNEKAMGGLLRALNPNLREWVRMPAPSLRATKEQSVTLNTFVAYSPLPAGAKALPQPRFAEPGPLEWAASPPEPCRLEGAEGASRELILRLKPHTFAGQETAKFRLICDQTHPVPLKLSDAKPVDGTVEFRIPWDQVVAYHEPVKAPEGEAPAKPSADAMSFRVEPILSEYDVSQMAPLSTPVRKVTIPAPPVPFPFGLLAILGLAIVVVSLLTLRRRIEYRCARVGEVTVASGTAFTSLMLGPKETGRAVGPAVAVHNQFHFATKAQPQQGFVLDLRGAPQEEGCYLLSTGTDYPFVARMEKDPRVAYDYALRVVPLHINNKARLVLTAIGVVLIVLGLALAGRG